MKTVYCYSSETIHYRTAVEVPDDATDDEIAQAFYDQGMGNDDEIASSGWQLDRIEEEIPLQA